MRPGAEHDICAFHDAHFTSGLLSQWCLLRVAAKPPTLPELATPQALHVEELAFQFSLHDDPLVFRGPAVTTGTLVGLGPCCLCTPLALLLPFSPAPAWHCQLTFAQRTPVKPGPLPG